MKATLESALGRIDAAVTVCDSMLDIVYMNEKSHATFAEFGGAKLLGKNLATCHKPGSMKKIETILSGTQPNVYTIKKNGIRKLIWQGPWISEDGSSGLVEISIPLPENIPHFDRD